MELYHNCSLTKPFEHNLKIEIIQNSIDCSAISILLTVLNEIYSFEPFCLTDINGSNNSCYASISAFSPKIIKELLKKIKQELHKKGKLNNVSLKVFNEAKPEFTFPFLSTSSIIDSITLLSIVPNLVINKIDTQKNKVLVSIDTNSDSLTYLELICKKTNLIIEK